ncbi:laminin subunit beta-2-like isoform X1 [Lagenorhynchus albirostris]|uniref:laminin subunit beta-2-like isoform X1 n=1 Tax=Lagenorhynchus albirostris TaxID=27610 RepID=UPI0028E9ACE2|nr:laminin subunit beta-2-like isoform X1 [Lagenorhynchus albirostris]
MPSELVVQGSCLCHGHASEYRPAPRVPPNMEGMVCGLCVCCHHRAGTHREHCQDLHQDHPWQAAEPGHPHACQASPLHIHLPCSAPESCRCNPQGCIPGTHDCDLSSGAYHCKCLVSGWDCSRCLGAPEPVPPHCTQAPGTSPGWLRPRLQRQCVPRYASTLPVSHIQAPKEPLPLHQGAGCTLWTGSDFARVVDGAGLSLLAPIVPSALECDIVLRYETQVVLLPQVKGLPGLRSVDPGATGHLQELHKAGCVEAARMSLSSTIPEACARLACSISALFQGGGLACECHPQGSLTTECALLGGQCCCHPNIDGRTCDHDRPGTCDFQPTGCRECCCHTKGATNAICNPVNGQ